MMRVYVGLSLWAVSLLPLVPTPAASQNWPQFRGPDMTGVVADDPLLPETWNATDNVAWLVESDRVGRQGVCDVGRRGRRL